MQRPHKPIAKQKQLVKIGLRKYELPENNYAYFFFNLEQMLWDFFSRNVLEFI